MNTNRKVLTQNLYNGERVLKSFKKDFPCLKSNTMLNRKILLHQNNEKYEQIIPLLKGKSIVAGLNTYKIRCEYDANTNNKIEYLENAMKKTKTGACRECSIIINNKFTKENIPAQNVRLSIKSKNSDNCDTHAFTLIGHNADADISNPKTWGKNAVIVDGWANIAKRAHEGLEYLKELFMYNPKTHDLNITKYNNT